VYEEHAMNDSVVRRWVRHFNEGRENVHDDRQSVQPSVVNEDLLRTVEKKIQENRQFTISSLSLHFPSRSLLREIVSGRGGSRIGTVELQYLLLPPDIIDNI
jgi:transposase-like protein